MDYETVRAEDFGRSLSGLGLNLLVRDVCGLASFLCDVFGMQSHRQSADFAILTYGDQLFQLHADHTYHSHPLPSLLPEAGPRGGGIEIRLYETDPDMAAELATAHAHGAVVLQPPTDKPHGLRECVILCENGYAWVPSRRLAEEEVAQVG
ncbi:MAG: hypothetical protein LJE67_15215 [Salaquimonas sp.]|jgi:DNA-binding transcriptional LysR family regulator|nr:hypothetical protein [Salaquimonas sp.]